MPSFSTAVTVHIQLAVSLVENYSILGREPVLAHHDMDASGASEGLSHWGHCKGLAETASLFELTVQGGFQVDSRGRGWGCTCMLAGPHSMKLASLRSLMRCRLLCTCVGSTSPYTPSVNIFEYRTPCRTVMQRIILTCMCKQAVVMGSQMPSSA